MVVSHPNLPYSVKLGNYWFKVATDPTSNTLRWARSPAPFFPSRISTQSVTQASMPPDVRVPYTFGDHSGGMGLSRIDGAEGVNQYWYAGPTTGNVDQGVDTSLGTQIILSAEVNRANLPNTPAPTSEFPGKFYYAPSRGTFYLGVGRYLFSRGTGNSWTLVQDFGAGYNISDIVEYRGTQASHYLYVCFGDSYTFQYQVGAGAWTAVSGSHKAKFFCKIEDKLYRVYSNTVDACTDGGASPNFSGPIDIGDNVGVVTGLYNHANRLVIGKSQGLFVLAADSATLEQNLHPEFWGNSITDYYSFGQGINFRGNLVTLYKKGMAAYDLSFNYTKAGLNALKDNTTPVTGQTVSIASDSNHVYYLLDSGYIIKGVVNQSGGAIASITPHPWLYIGSASSGMMGFDPSSIALYVMQGSQILRMLLSPTGNPLEYSSYRYCPAGVLYEPPFYGGFTQEDKQYFSLLVDAKNLAGNIYAQHGYKTTEGASYTNLTASKQTQDPGIRVDLSTPPKGRAYWASLTLATDTVGTTPIVSSHTVSYVVLADPIMVMMFTLDLTEGAMLQDGSSQILHPDVVSRRLEAMVNSGAVPLTDPWGRLYDVTIPLDGYVEQAGEPHFNKDPDLMVSIKAITQRQRERGTFSVLSQYKFSELKNYRFSQLRTL